jgi:hypothetical protein
MKAFNPTAAIGLVACVAFSLGLLGCGGGGGGGGDPVPNPSTPVISNQSIAPAFASTDGVTVTVNGTFDFTDAGGDLSTVTLIASDASGNQLFSNTSPISGVSGVTGGTARVTVTATNTWGTYSYQLYVTDAAGLRSNTLTGSVRISEQPWTQKAPMPTPRYNGGAAVVNNEIYVIGGNVGNKLLNTVEKYNPATDAWTTGLASMPTARSDLAVVAVNGQIYAIGGSTSWAGTVMTGVLERYDPTSDSWTTLSPMPVPAGYVAGAVVNGKIYVIGGEVPDYHTCATVREYDPATDTWTTKADMPTARKSLSAAVVNGKIYAVGGSGGALNGEPTVEEYDPLSDTWATKAAMPTPRQLLSAVGVNGKVYVIGGGLMGGRFSSPDPTVERYDPASNTWTQKISIPFPVLGPAVAAVNGKIYSVGGMVFAGQFLPGPAPLDKNQEYDPTKDP